MRCNAMQDAALTTQEKDQFLILRQVASRCVSVASYCEPGLSVGSTDMCILGMNMCCNGYLGCQELWCAAEGAGARAVPHGLFAEAKVGNLDKPVLVQKKVV